MKTATTVEAGKGEIEYGTKLEANNMIVMIRQMEVTWGRSNCEQDTSSTESLVHGRKVSGVLNDFGKRITLFVP